MQRTSIYLDDQDRAALAIIKAAHGIATDAGAIRFAVRELARGIERRARRNQPKGRVVAGAETGGGES
jgi:hypothetical protein